MITDSDVATTVQSADPAATAGSPRPRRGPAAVVRRGAGLAGKLAAIGLIAAVGVFNAWWYWRDTRPLADPAEIDRWIARRRYDDAEAALRERLRREPHDGATRTTLARIRAARGDLLGCARELGEIPYWWPQKAESLFRQAQALLAADHAREAEVALKAVIDADPLHPPDPGLHHDACQELLKIYATEDRWDDAFDVIWKSYDRAAPPDRPAVLSMRIRCELERVAHAESMKLLRRYVAADPADFEALRALANAELAVGQRAEAVRDMEACLRARPEDPRTWRDYLTMLRTLGEQEAFAAALARAPRSADGEPEIWMFRGQAREREGDWAGAADDYGRALQLNPYLVNANYRLAIIEERLGRREQAALHRRRWEEAREARAQLPQASERYSAALAAATAPEPAPNATAELRTATRRLASLCTALGWARAAEAWNQIAAGL